MKLLENQSPSVAASTLSTNQVPEVELPSNSDELSDMSPLLSPGMEEHEYNLTELPTTPIQTPLHISEREMLYTEMDNLRKERDEAFSKFTGMETLISAGNLSSASVEGNNEACKMLTGVSWCVFLQIFLYVSTFVGKKGTTKASLPQREQLFLTLVKLRHNLSFDLLAHVKGIPKSTTIDYFWKWIDLLYSKIGFMVRWQDRETIFQSNPPVFKSKFPRLTSIIDCFEIFIDAPKNLLARAQCWSSYKKHCTIKVFISCTPLGAVNFLSPTWGGRASDVHIVRDSGFIDPKYHLPHDQILADRGFTLYDDFAAKCSACLLTPAFTKGKKQLSAQDVEMSRKISSVRIHIERVIGLIKNRFGILQGPIPIRCVQSLKDETLETTLSSCDKIIQVCSALTNMSTSVVYKR